ncbi:MAG: CmcJ/NvfI family oxidoreductase [Polyangiales bacterium]
MSLASSSVRASTAREPHPYVDVDLNYLRATGERPVNYAFTPPEGTPQRSGEVVPARVRVHNARVLAEPPTLDASGFERLAHESALGDFGDDARIREIYYPEVVALLKRATGASHVVIFDHTKRLAHPSHKDEGLREAATRVHNDQTFVSGPRRVRDHLPPEQAEARLAKRHGIINVWRPIGVPAATHPLAMCDARSIDPSDLITSDLVYRDKVGETYSFSHNPRHHWLYYPALRPDEVLLLKIYDSLTDGTARLTAHTSFEDPTAPANAPPRRSIEVRTLVFWD